MRSNEIRLRKLEGQMRRNEPPMTEEERTARINELLAKVRLSYEGLLARYGSAGGFLRAIEAHYGSIQQFLECGGWQPRNAHEKLN